MQRSIIVRLNRIPGGEEEEHEEVISQIIEDLAQAFFQSESLSVTMGLSNAQIANIPMRLVWGVEKKETCTICQDTFTVNRYQKVLPCQHKFHPNCINSWLVKSMHCPNCRKAVVLKE